MIISLYIGLAVSLGGPVLLLLAATKFRFNSLAVLPRLLLWLFALVALVFAALGGGPWLLRLGVQPFGWLDLLAVVVATVVTLFGVILLQLLERALGFTSSKAPESLHKITSLSVPYRTFVVVTAAVVEEVLYRGYAIGIGQHVFGSLVAAFVVSLIAFVLVHFRWGKAQLVPVLWAALVMSLLFVLTNNLFACILAHFVVDAVGFLVMPWVASRQKAQRVSSAQEG